MAKKNFPGVYLFYAKNVFCEIAKFGGKRQNFWWKNGIKNIPYFLDMSFS